MKQLAILIPTLPIRIKRYSYLVDKLNKQIVKNNLVDKVQILSFCDSKDYPVGQKRNLLIKWANATYICFIDDDDDISDNYVSSIYNATLKGVDCITFNGRFISADDVRDIHMSLLVNEDYNTETCYYRIPNHLSVIKREIALKCKFPDVNYGEDSVYSKKLKKHLVTEHHIPEKLYFYLFNINTSQTDPNSNSNQFVEKP